MKVRVMMPQAGIQAGVKAIGPDGKEVEIACIEIEPFFYRKNERSPLAFLEVTHGGKTFSRATLTISGATAQLALQHRRKPVKSRFELEAEQASTKKKEPPKTADTIDIPLPPQ